MSKKYKAPKTKRRPRTPHASTPEKEGISLLEPRLDPVRFSDFPSLAQSYDALIAEFYSYYRKKGQDDPSLFGFVAVRHVVEFTPKIKSVCTENLVGQKTTVIYAPLIPDETPEHQERRLRLLVAFDYTQRASHILALSLLVSVLSENGLRKLTEKHCSARNTDVPTS